MADIYPGARWRPLGEQTQPRMTSHDIICLHTAVGSLAGTYAYFAQRGYGGDESHFGVGAAGEVEQWQDLEHTADANLDGAHRVISIETADKGGPFPDWSDASDVPAWTDGQLEALAELIAWLADRYDIPLQLIPDSRPGRRGVGYHRQGVDPWRVPGGERWSTKAGKVCPGSARIAQIPEVIKRAREIAAGGEVPFMALTDAEQREILAGNREILAGMRKLKPGVALPARSTNCRIKSDDHYGHTMNAEAEAADALAEVRAFRAEMRTALGKLSIGAVVPADLADEMLRRIAAAVSDELARRQAE